jgi:hypothetical protein
MGDVVVIGEEDEEAVEAEGDDEDNNEGMKEMEFTMEDDGKGVRGETTRGGNNKGRGGNSTLRRLWMTSQGGGGEGGDSSFP